MTYEEYFQHLQELRKTHTGQQSSEQYLDEQIALINQLPCTGKGPSKPVFSNERHVGIAVGLLDSGAPLPPEFGCMHCTMLAAYNWVKSAIDADRNGTPLQPMP